MFAWESGGSLEIPPNEASARYCCSLTNWVTLAAPRPSQCTVTELCQLRDVLPWYRHIV